MSSTAPSAATAAMAGTTFKVGVARQVDVYVDFKSLSAADASGPPGVASLVNEFNALSRSWETIRAKFSFMNIPAITLPAAARVTVRKKVPGSYLSVRAITPTPISATTTGTDSTWMVTFNNPPQGDDHDISYTVRFSFAGFPDQDRVRTAKLRPAKYTVASLILTPAVDTVMVGKSATITWAARDSSGDVLPDSLLLGRMPAWTSASTNIATVGATSGTVSGVSAGGATINAVLETGRATASVLVVPDITGTYTLTTENGIRIPGIVYQDSVYKIETSSGSVTLRADGTFGYSRSAKGTNVKTNLTYNEGGSGSGKYIVNATGTGLTFEVTASEGVPTTFGAGSVNGNVLSVSVTTPTGSGSATLTKQ
jgi:hypothetical protein